MFGIIVIGTLTATSYLFNRIDKKKKEEKE